MNWISFAGPNATDIKISALLRSRIYWLTAFALTYWRKCSCAHLDSQTNSNTHYQTHNKSSPCIKKYMTQRVAGLRAAKSTWVKIVHESSSGFNTYKIPKTPSVLNDEQFLHNEWNIHQFKNLLPIYLYL